MISVTTFSIATSLILVAPKSRLRDGSATIEAVVTKNGEKELPRSENYYFSSGFDELEPLPETAGSASSGAGGGVVNIVQPIQPVIPRIPKTPKTTGMSIA